MRAFRGISGLLTLTALFTLSTGCDVFPRVEVNCQVGKRTQGTDDKSNMQHCEFNNYGAAATSGCVVIRVLPTDASPDKTASEMVSNELCYNKLEPKAKQAKISCLADKSACHEHLKCAADPNCTPQSTQGVACANHEKNTCQKGTEPGQELYKCNQDFRNDQAFGTCTPGSLELKFSSDIRKACLKQVGKKSHFTCRVLVEEHPAR